MASESTTKTTKTTKGQYINAFVVFVVVKNNVIASGTVLKQQTM